MIEGEPSGAIGVLDKPEEQRSDLTETSAEMERLSNNADTVSTDQVVQPATEKLPLAEQLEAIRSELAVLVEKGLRGSKRARELAQNFDGLTKQQIKADLDKKYAEKIAHASPVRGALYYVQRLAELGLKMMSREDPATIGTVARKDFEKTTPQPPRDNSSQPNPTPTP